MTGKAERPGLAVLGALTAFLLFSAVDVIMKYLTQRYPLVEVNFLSSAIAMVPTTLACWMQNRFRGIRTAAPGPQAARALCSMATGLLVLFAFSRMPIADTYALAFSAPLFITALAGPLLHEPVGWRRWAAVGAGFVGILVMLRPGSGAVDFGALAALGSAISYALAMLIVRRAQQGGRAASGATFAFYSIGFTVLAMGCALPFVWVTPAPEHLALVTLSGLMAGSATVLVLSAYAKAPAAVIAPLQYTQMVWGVVWGWLVFSDRPDRFLILGAVIIIASGLFIRLREWQLGRRIPAVVEPL
jgi:drug/metabolite transporter (DMT)-like permease